jgi:DNA invertase Pin-like site-specific DNA recombinase
MHLASDYIHPTPRGGRCRIRIYLPEEERDAPVVICSELPSNEDSSVTYSAHQIAAEVLRYHLENTLDNFSEFERFMIADRMRRGKRSKSKQGKLVAGPQSDYGFRYNDARDGYEVDEVRMALVRRIFRMVGVEGMTLNAVAGRLEAEGIPAPRGGAPGTDRRSGSSSSVTCISDTATKRSPR